MNAPLNPNYFYVSDFGPEYTHVTSEVVVKFLARFLKRHGHDSKGYASFFTRTTPNETLVSVYGCKEAEPRASSPVTKIV